MENLVFYRCDICGNLIVMIENSGNIPQCCGQAMERLEPGKVDAVKEKHVPVITCDDKKVTITVGEIPHPMSELHYIEWICLQTNRGVYMRRLYPGEVPSVHFRLCASEKPICAYEYCNLHGLWQSCVQKE